MISVYGVHKKSQSLGIVFSSSLTLLTICTKALYNKLYMHNENVLQTA